MELSKRLYAIAGMVKNGASVADVGTDHGYIPVYLIKKKIAYKAIALDINQGPLERAKKHIKEYGVEGQIDTRISDGLGAVRPGEVDTMIAAGMGGGLIIKILEEGWETVEKMEQCILQPQSDIRKVRRYLIDQGFQISEEDMVEEDGKFYPVMKAVHGSAQEYDEYEYIYGRELLRKRHPVLKRYLLREKALQEHILEELGRQESKRALLRAGEIRRELSDTLQALKCYERV